MLGWIGIGLIAGAIVVLTPIGPYPGWRAVVPVVGAALVLFSGVEATSTRRWLAAAPLQYVGKLSYSLYLWHWPVVTFAHVLRPELGTTGILACTALTFALAEASFRLVEHPIRASGRVAQNPKTTVMGGAAATLFGLGAAAGVTMQAMSASAAPAQREVADAARQESPLLGKDHRCLVLIFEARAIPCRIGSSTHPPIVLVGDSHAAQWVTPLAAAADAAGRPLVTFLKIACPVALLPVYYHRVGREYRECAEWQREMLARVIALRPAVVIFAHHSNGYLSADPAINGGTAITPQAWEEGMLRTLRTVQAAGLPTVILRDTPRAGFDVATCLARSRARGRDDAGCALTKVASIDSRALAAENRAASAVHARVINLTGLFCGRDMCPATKDGLVVYRDGNHISEAAAVAAGPALRRALHLSLGMKPKP